METQGYDPEKVHLTAEQQKIDNEEQVAAELGLETEAQKETNRALREEIARREAEQATPQEDPTASWRERRDREHAEAMAGIQRMARELGVTTLAERESAAEQATNAQLEAAAEELEEKQFQNRLQQYGITSPTPSEIDPH